VEPIEDKGKQLREERLRELASITRRVQPLTSPASQVKEVNDLCCMPVQLKLGVRLCFLNISAPVAPNQCLGVC